MVNMNDLGANIMMHRKIARLTQDELAIKAGISKPYLHQVESGKANMTFEIFNKLLNALEIKATFKLSK